MDLAQRNFLKYQSEYRAETEDELLLSPVSTSPEVYSVFPHENSTLALDLNYVYDNVPHMKKLWPKGYQTEVDFLPAVMKAPSYLETAFPERAPEACPAAKYYSLDGDPKEIAISTRSSHGAGGDFELPPEDRKGKRKAKATRERSSPGAEPPVGTAVQALDDAQPSDPTVGHWDLSSASQGILGSETPYKDPSSFFVPKSPRGFSRSTIVPGFDLPNPIFGMATPD
ncbi:hypothetical protein B0H13DRAFT_2386913 [Mycena leptocephala]|nr:hypothetical protein B0H13DRAFT_2386913 [Mycena leptocephala]